MQKGAELSGAKAELCQLSSDKESRMLAEFEKLSLAQHQQTSSHCDQLAQSLKVTRQFHQSTSRTGWFRVRLRVCWVKS